MAPRRPNKPSRELSREPASGRRRLKPAQRGPPNASLYDLTVRTPDVHPAKREESRSWFRQRLLAPEMPAYQGGHPAAGPRPYNSLRDPFRLLIRPPRTTLDVWFSGQSWGRQRPFGTIPHTHRTPSARRSCRRTPPRLESQQKSTAKTPEHLETVLGTVKECLGTRNRSRGMGRDLWGSTS